MRNRIWVTWLFLVLSACSHQKAEIPEQEPVLLEFFTVKEETLPILNQLIADFESEYPRIKVKQVIVPNGMSVLKARLARGDAPDLFISYPLEQDYVTRAEKGYLLDLSDEMFLDRIQPTIQQKYSLDGKMYGAAFTQNAVGVLYNKQHFEELNLSVPATWSQWISVMGTLKEAGKQPIVMGNKDADQTSILSLNFVANSFPTSYWEGNQPIAGDPTWKKINQKVEAILSYTNPDSFEMGYRGATEAFANGEGSMYVMGTWVLPLVEKLNSGLEYGFFPVPVSDVLEENKVLGGVDIGISISSDTLNPTEAKLFLAFLTREENAQSLSFYEGSIPTIMGVSKMKESLETLAQKVQEGESVNWPNHYWPGGTAAESEYRLYTQQFFHDRDGEQYLKNLEKMFVKYRSSRDRVDS